MWIYFAGQKRRSAAGVLLRARSCARPRLVRVVPAATSLLFLNTILTETRRVVEWEGWEAVKLHAAHWTSQSAQLPRSSSTFSSTTTTTAAAGGPEPRHTTPRSWQQGEAASPHFSSKQHLRRVWLRNMEETSSSRGAGGCVFTAGAACLSALWHLVQWFSATQNAAMWL